MGGPGSGRWGGHTKKTTVEQCRSISVRRMYRDGLLEPGQSYTLTWSDAITDEQKASMGVVTSADSIRLRYTIYWRDGEPEDIRYCVPLTWTPCNWGGEYPWFACPGAGCGRRVGKLYLPPGGAKYFLCRHCYDLSYRSRQTYDKRLAALRRDPSLIDAFVRDPKTGKPALSRALAAMRVLNGW